jgi:cobalt-zinc-cadmium efflux system membrane fusion protein
MNCKANLVRQLTTSIPVLIVIGFAGFLLTRQAKSASKETTVPSSGNTITISDRGRQVVHIKTETVRCEPLEESIRTTGQVEFPSDQTVKISPRLQGRIRQVFVRVGDPVSVGQTLAILDSVDAATAQTTARQNENRLRQARINLERQERLYRLGTPDVTSAQATLDQARASAASARDVLDRTKEQERIGGFTQKPLEDAENALVTANSALSQAESDLALAQRDFDRKTKLVEIGVAARSDLEAAQNALEKAKVNVSADQESVRLAKQAVEREQKAYRSNLYADQQVRQAESAYHQAELQQAAAERALRLAKAAILRDLQQAQSDYQSAQYDDANSRRALELLGKPNPDGTLPVASPINGIVIERNVSPGQVVDQSQMTPWQMFTISDADTVWIDADIYEKDIAAVTPGTPVQIHVAALPNRVFTGAVRYIAPTLDPKTRTIKVRAEIANPGRLLKDGMYADVTILIGKEHAVPVVPLEAVQHDGDSDYVYISEGGNYVKRSVSLGVQRSGRCVVQKGLREGDRVVTQGALFLGSQASGG